MKENTLPDAGRREQLTRFFWTAWAAATEREGAKVTYTNNWPHEPLIGNVPSSENVMWSIISVVVLLAGIGLLIWAWAFLRGKEEDEPEAPRQDPLSTFALTPSQRALGKYLFLVVALFGLQVLLGAFTAHYTVEGQKFYGLDLSQWFPYSLVRTWHIQSALFWIATGFLAAGLFLAPLINGGRDPKFQKIGVDILFWALVVVVVGSFTGNYLAIAQIMPPELNFWLGHQGYEYVDLGRLWQIGKFTGICFWLVLMLRGIVPALRQPGGDKNLLALLTASVGAIGLFYGAGFFYGERTHLTVMEYWRWWIVHLWVEGFFEVFATTALAFIFSTLGLVSRRMATTASLASASLFMLGGIPGTFHHFAGTTTPVMAIGASFSALEVVPLIVLGHEAWENWRLKTRAPWMADLKWPLMLRGGGLLEHAGRGRVRLHDQPADLAVLHPGPEHHAGPRARGPVRRVRFPGAGLHAAGAALHPTAIRAESRPDEAGLLGPEHRPGADDLHQPAAGRTDPVPRQRQRRHVVRAQRSLHAAGHPESPALGPHLRRRGVPAGRAGAGGAGDPGLGQAASRPRQARPANPSGSRLTPEPSATRKPPAPPRTWCRRGLCVPARALPCARQLAPAQRGRSRPRVHISACAGACRLRASSLRMHARPLVLALLLRCPPAAATGPAPPAPMSRLPPGEVSYTPPGEALPRAIR